MRRLAAGLSVIATLTLCAVPALHSAWNAHASLHPLRKPVVRPAGSAELEGLQDVAFRASDGILLRGWWLPSRNGAGVILAHGVAENRTQMLFEAKALSQRGYGVLLFDWRGHGASEGSLVTWGDLERRDLRAALNWIAVRPDVQPGRIGAVGFSMGGAVVSLVSGEDRRLASIVLEGTDSSLADGLRDDYSNWGLLSLLPAHWVYESAGVNIEQVRPLDALRKRSDCPLLLINGTQDEVPLESAARLFAAAQSPKTCWIVRGARHGEYEQVAPQEYTRRLVAHFDATLLAHRNETVQRRP